LSNVVVISRFHSEPPVGRSISEIAIWTKPLARRTLPRVRGASFVVG
jgi:hypothetical protein